MAAPTPAPFFVLSYGRADGPRVGQFFEDLADEVRRKATEAALRKLDNSKIGFMDTRSTGHGDQWDPALQSALRCARTYVGLLSRSYLSSDYCGREFELFRRRVEKHAPPLPNGGRPKLIKPVLWQPETRLLPLPDVLRPIQYARQEYGPLYLEKGVAALIGQKRHRDEYEQFLDAFAWQLVDDANECLLPSITDGPSLDDVVSPFLTTSGRATDRRKVGPSSIRLIFAVGTRDEMPETGANHAAYGEAFGRDWVAFTSHEVPVGPLCSGIVSNEGLWPVDLEISPNVIGEIREAEEANAIVLLIVDPYSARLERLRSFLESYDEGNFVNTGVLVLWGDGATARDEDALRQNVKRLLSRTVVMNGHISDSVRGPDQLRAELLAAVHEIRRRMAARGDFSQNIGGEKVGLPRLVGPGGGR